MTIISLHNRYHAFTQNYIYNIFVDNIFHMIAPPPLMLLQDVIE